MSHNILDSLHLQGRKINELLQEVPLHAKMTCYGVLSEELINDHEDNNGNTENQRTAMGPRMVVWAATCLTMGTSFR